MSVHINAPRAHVVWRYLDCPTCDRRRRFTMWIYEWYGPHVICWGCGERFDEDGRSERPFTPRWRERNKDRARRAVRSAGRPEWIGGAK